MKIDNSKVVNDCLNSARILYVGNEVLQNYGLERATPVFSLSQKGYYAKGYRKEILRKNT